MCGEHAHHLLCRADLLCPHPLPPPSPQHPAGVSDADAAATVLVFLLGVLDTIACTYLTAQRGGPVVGGPVDDSDTSASDLRSACIKVRAGWRQGGLDSGPVTVSCARV